ncbi:hypothetical protein F5879DRAFT_993027 [Lentinula edodes]|uniref:uncharacterized protein n=1 Tax=Lentinula edodes TaxID=5353 RepID=UPI001E8D92D1|nr:uncharacterized protein C8R40DRAFT_1175784 [Lentinula edodes]KAH7870301.1 hypothetical protein C8R40DRAFT_1175784 [Lentinula edodes]KAJ3900283.1 hypothetical protein F5879DRAFT_993027 [Lentinula edodes]
MHLNIVYFMLGLGLSLFSNVWAMPLSDDGNAMYKRAANTVYIKLKSTAEKQAATPFLTAGLPYIFKNMLMMGFSQDAHVHIAATEHTSEMYLTPNIFFDIYANSKMLTTFKGMGILKPSNEMSVMSLPCFGVKEKGKNQMGTPTNQSNTQV